jgi:Uma2 family endonuclease
MSIYSLEARSPEAYSSPSQTVYKPSAPKEEFPYGWRHVIKKLPNGQETYSKIPLTAKDFLNPQLGDQMIQRVKHAQCSIDIFNQLKNHYMNDLTVGVFFDLKIEWGISGLAEPAPDVSVIPHLKDKEADRGTFKVSKENTRPCLVIEVMSPTYPGDDTDKVRIYEKAGVQEYFIVNPHAGKTKPYYEVWAYRLENGKYQAIKSDNQGRLLSDTTQVLFGVYNNGQHLRLKNALTGEWLMTAQESEAARLKEIKARQEETKAKEKAEARAEAETKARIKLEQRLKELESQQK